MAVCCCFHRTPQSRLCSILFSLTIVVALHVFAFVAKYHASRQVHHCNNYGCGSKEQVSLAVIVVCFVAEFIYLLAFAFPKYICPVDPREEPDNSGHERRGPRDLPTDGRVVSGAGARCFAQTQRRVSADVRGALGLEVV